MILSQYTDMRAAFAPGAPPALGGFETWPIASVVYSPGLPGFNLLLPPDLTQVGLYLCVNGTTAGQAGADDATPFADEFDWYVSQRTDGLGKPFDVLSWNQANQGQANTKSGTIVLVLRDGQYLDSTVTPPLIRSENFSAVYRDVEVYVRRRSDGAIMWGNLLAYAESVS